MGRVRAVIDVGTNSVKLLVAEVERTRVTPLLEDSTQTRLGQGFYETHILQDEPIRKSAEAIRDFVEAALPFNPESVKVFATSAARDALNKDELVQAVRKAAGLDLLVISGEQEADWVFQGVTTDPLFRDQHLLVMDIGGGSTEFVLGHNEKRQFAQSFQLGSVRLLEKYPPRDPPAEDDFQIARNCVMEVLQKEVSPALAPQISGLAERPLLVGTGGTASILARIEFALDSYDREKMEGATITQETLQGHLRQLWRLPLEERKRVRGLPKKRADVILMGALVYASVMEIFDFPLLRVSTRGLRFAAILNLG